MTYRVTSTAGGQAISATQTWYVSGKNFRMDLAVGQASVTTMISIFATGEGTFSCVSGGGGETQCLSVALAQAFGGSPGAAFDAQIRANPDAFGGTFKESRTIAGTSASCYGVAGTATGFSLGTICYTSTGVPLLYQFEASGLSFTMEATTFGVPTDADFKLLAPVQR